MKEDYITFPPRHHGTSILVPPCSNYVSLTFRSPSIGILLDEIPQARRLASLSRIALGSYEDQRATILSDQ